jgi:hypothetical protein
VLQGPPPRPLPRVLAGSHDVALPGLLLSLTLFGVCVFLYRLVLKIDRMKEREQASEGPRPGPWRIGRQGAEVVRDTQVLDLSFD